MNTGAITGYFDVAQIVLYVFWIFFAGLLLYLRREDKREGYPLESAGGGAARYEGFPRVPKPKTFALADGRTVLAPRAEAAAPPVDATPTSAYRGSPLQPNGDPMTSRAGPGAYVERGDHPERLRTGEPMIVPMRGATGFEIAAGDPDPRGMAVFGADGARAGVVSELWVDRAEPQIRYFEVEIAGGRRVLLPVHFGRLDGRRGCIRVRSILASQFSAVPATASDGQITLREEDRIAAYYASGTLYATPDRLGPWL